MNRAYPYASYRYAGYSMPKQHPIPEKYPEDIECVYPSTDPTKGAIYVSNVEAASNIKTLNRFNIKAVMTCAKGYDRDVPKSKLDMFQYFPFDDKQTCMIAPFFQTASDFISNALSKTNILVHCIAGVSRSVSMVIAYLIRDKGMSYEDAYKTIKSRRSIISPNDGFIKQLKQYAQQIRERMNRAGNRTPVKSRSPNLYQTSSVSPSSKNQNQIKYITTIKKSDTFYKKSGSINNEEDQPLLRGKTDAWNKLQNNFSTPFAYKKQEPKYNYKMEDDLHMTKSSTFIENDRPKTPEKVVKNESPKIHTSVSRPRSAYFEQMNKQLNSKIEAIHAKYEKQREALLAKRGVGLPTKLKDERSISYNILSKEDKLSSRGSTDYRRGLLGGQNIGKYTEIYDNKYARGLNYDFGRSTINSTGYYRNRYYL